jgi:hypothetical protein
MSVPASNHRAILTHDTTREAEALQVQAWRGMSSVELASLIAGASRSARTLAMAGLRWRYPDASETELTERWAVLTLGVELARAVYPDVDRLLERSA